jgi:hypothetical protein
MSTTFERLQGATLSLARSAPIKERLTDAFRNHLALIEENELPSELREEFRTLSHDVTRERPLLRGEDALRATVRKLSCDEAEAIASRVVHLFGDLSRTQAVNGRPKAQKAAPAVVPLYLAEAAEA